MWFRMMAWSMVLSLNGCETVIQGGMTMKYQRPILELIELIEFKDDVVTSSLPNEGEDDRDIF